MTNLTARTAIAGLLFPLAAIGAILAPAAATTPWGLGLRGPDNGGKDDLLKVNAISDAEGATATLSRKRSDGTWKQLGTAVLNEKGNCRFEELNDLNGNAQTRYKVVLEATAETERRVGKIALR